MHKIAKVFVFIGAAIVGAAGMNFWDSSVQRFQLRLVENELQQQKLEPAVDVRTVGFHGAWAQLTDIKYIEKDPDSPADLKGIAEADAKARPVFATPGGAYTKEDIALNGSTAPFERFHRTRFNCAMRPFPGQPVDPILGTKCSPAFGWYVGGQLYHFASIASIEEFVLRAKHDPSTILPASTYIQPKAETVASR